MIFVLVLWELFFESLELQLHFLVARGEGLDLVAVLALGVKQLLLEARKLPLLRCFDLQGHRKLILQFDEVSSSSLRDHGLQLPSLLQEWIAWHCRPQRLHRQLLADLDSLLATHALNIATD